MLNMKTVAIGHTEMHLWDETGNFVCSYDMHADRDMCHLLHTMIDQNVYRLKNEPEAMLPELAVLEPSRHSRRP